MKNIDENSANKSLGHTAIKVFYSWQNDTDSKCNIPAQNDR